MTHPQVCQHVLSKGKGGHVTLQPTEVNLEHLYSLMYRLSATPLVVSKLSLIPHVITLCYVVGLIGSQPGYVNVCMSIDMCPIILLRA